MFCDNCGRQVKKETATCPYCGAELVLQKPERKKYYLYSGTEARMRVLTVLPLFTGAFGVAALLSFISVVVGILTFAVLALATAAVFSSYISDYVELKDDGNLLIVRRYGREKMTVSISSIDRVKVESESSDLWFQDNQKLRSYEGIQQGWLRAFLSRALAGSRQIFQGA